MLKKLFKRIARPTSGRVKKIRHICVTLFYLPFWRWKHYIITKLAARRIRHFAELTENGLKPYRAKSWLARFALG